MNKPRIYPRWYPKLGVAYWCVSRMPSGLSTRERVLWKKAYRYVGDHNLKVEPINATP